MKNPISNQDGAILIVTLIILMLLTALATSSFQSSTMQEKMAAASGQRSIAFQTAESAVEDVLNNTANFTAITVLPEGTTQDLTPTFTTDSKVGANASITQKGKTVAKGSSIVQGSGFVSYVFEVTGHGQMQRGTTAVSEADVIQGVQWTAPN